MSDLNHNLCIQVVQNLNEKLYEQFNFELSPFEYITNGEIGIINFGSQCLWHSAEDERDFNEKLNEYEPLEPYIIKKYNEYIDELNSIKL